MGKVCEDIPFEAMLLQCSLVCTYISFNLPNFYIVLYYNVIIEGFVTNKRRN